MGGANARSLGLFTATSLVVATMIGTGIFTTSGYLAADLKSPGNLLLVWVLGGLLAMAGALSYGELAAAMPREGAEYAYLRRIYAPWVGSLSGFISMVAGFGGPIAAVALAMGFYLEAVVPALPDQLTATVVIVLFSALHMWRVREGARVQDWTSILKVVIVLVFIGAGLLAEPRAAESLSGIAAPGMLSGSFAAALVIVAFAYSGWNAAAYMGGEIRNPGWVLPWSLITGTGLVTLLYVLLNLVYLRGAAPHEMAGVKEVGHLAATRLLGEGAGSTLSLGIAALMLSSVSGMILTGSRVIMAMSRDGELPAMLSRTSFGGAPHNAVLLQGLIALAFVWAIPFGTLIVYIGLTLSLFYGLTVFGLLVLRRREPELERPFRVPGYPLVPLAFVLFSGWMIAWSVQEQPMAAAWSAVTLFVGLVLRVLLSRR